VGKRHGTITVQQYPSALWALLGFVLILVFYDTTQKLRTAFAYPWTEAQLREYRSARMPGYKLIMTANESLAIAGAPIYMFGFGNTGYFYHGSAVGDLFGVARATPAVQAGSRAVDPQLAASLALWFTLDYDTAAYLSRRFGVDPEAAADLARRFGAKAVVIDEKPYPRVKPYRWHEVFQLIDTTAEGSLWLIRDNP
jgi:hypothetical protein